MPSGSSYEIETDVIIAALRSAFEMLTPKAGDQLFIHVQYSTASCLYTYSVQQPRRISVIFKHVCNGFVTSVCLSVCLSAPTGRIFIKFDV